MENTLSKTVWKPKPIDTDLINIQYNIYVTKIQDYKPTTK